jgi:hypothetical protein
MMHSPNIKAQGGEGEAKAKYLAHCSTCIGSYDITFFEGNAKDIKVENPRDKYYECENG